MPFAIKAENLRKEWAGKPVFEKVTFEIEEGEHIALFGRNGVGKSTLITGLMGKTSFDEGKLDRRYPVSEWGWLEQHLDVASLITLREFIQSSQPRIHDLGSRLEQLQRELEAVAREPNKSRGEATATDSTDQLEKLVEQYGRVQEEYAALGGYEFEMKLEAVLTRFQFPEPSWNQPYDTLSGGVKTRAQLARLMMREPRMLILDEPTNHLDAETLDWLEDWLCKYTGTVVFVSHDRQFIDATAQAVLYLTSDEIKRYEGGYTAFRKQRDLEIATQQALYDKQQREKEALLTAISNYKAWYQQAHDAAGIDFYLRKKAEKNSTRFKAKERQLERLEARMVDRPRQDAKLNVQFRDDGFEARTLLQLRDVTFSYDSATALFHTLSLTVSRGDRLAVIGENGAGKSTLLRLMTGRLSPDAGSVEFHPALAIGYFAQELDDLDVDLTVLDTLLDIPGMTQSYARTVLAGFLFPREDVFKRVGDLSMGERCRVAFVKLYFSGANLLVLDEPTNYLDVDARERIEEALLSYPGALLLVSHDRYLVRRVANRVLHLTKSDAGSSGQAQTEVAYFPGTVDDYQTTKEDREDGVSLDVKNRIRQLELQIAQDMSLDATDDAISQGDLLQRIREAKRELDILRATAKPASR